MPGKSEELSLGRSCVYGISRAPGGEMLTVDGLGHILSKNIYWGGRKRNHPYDPGFLMVPVGQLSMEIYRNSCSFKYGTSFFATGSVYYLDT